jgi:hypothetical protein
MNRIHSRHRFIGLAGVVATVALTTSAFAATGATTDRGGQFRKGEKAGTSRTSVAPSPTVAVPSRTSTFAPSLPRNTTPVVTQPQMPTRYQPPVVHQDERFGRDHHGQHIGRHDARSAHVYIDHNRRHRRKWWRRFW